ncbi:MAG: D-alanyl-D-alanine carboxypeptidase/D-alanyl-D-alanine-endopeptidase [Myxococcota bacterium]
MKRLPTALLATVAVLASSLAAQGSQAADTGIDTQILEGGRSAGATSPLSPGGRGDSSSSTTVPQAAPAVDPVAAKWRARIARRLATVRGEAELQPAEAPLPTEPGHAALKAELSRLTQTASRVADVGVAVRRMDTGAPVFSYQADHELNPASNHKLLTAIAAVELLGADYRFSTEVRIDGDSLVLVGDGDPSLQVADVRALAAQTVASGVDLRRIKRIVADDTAFTPQRFGPGYAADGPGWSYLAPSGALSLQFNTVTVAVRPGTDGGAARIAVEPASPHVIVENHTQAGRRNRISVQTYARGNATVVDVRGTMGPRGIVSERRRISDPTRFTASTFAMALAAHREGTVLPVVVGPAPDQARTVASHHSAPLPEVLSAALVFSNNFTSEQVLRTLGRRMSGAPGDWDNGRVALERFWDAMGRDRAELTFENASGYSRQGRLTADAIVALLARTQRPGSAAASLADILPASGRQGTMRHRLARTRGRVRAKTVTLSGASALSGLVVSRDGQRAYGFSILVNGSLPHHSSRRLQDRLVMALVEHLH